MILEWCCLLCCSKMIIQGVFYQPLVLTQHNNHVIGFWNIKQTRLVGYTVPYTHALTRTKHMRWFGSLNIQKTHWQLKSNYDIITIIVMGFQMIPTITYINTGVYNHNIFFTSTLAGHLCIVPKHSYVDERWA